MKNIMFIASRFPYPAKSGRERTLLEYLSFLKGYANVYFYFFEREKPDDRILRDFKNKYNIKEITFLKLPALLLVITNIIRYSLLFKKKSIQESVFYNKKIEKFLLREIFLKNIDIVFTDMIRTAQYYEHVQKENILKIFDMDDMISKRYQYLKEQRDVNILGNFSKNLPKVISNFIEKQLRNFVLNLEEKLIEKREIELINKYDKTILVSPKEVNFLRKKTKNNNIYYVYPTVEIQNKEQNIEKVYPSISFMGLLNVPHNEKALLKFIDDIFPQVLNKYPKLKFYIIGANPPEKLQKKVKKYSNNIVLTGYVKDFKEYISKTNIFVAPIYFGTGIKTKILDAMSLKMPVVTTPIGVEGLKIKNFKNILIAKNEKEFVEFLFLLLENKNLMEFIGKEAYKYIYEFHNYEKIKKQYIEILEI